MDNIQLYHIDNEINKVDEMKEGDNLYIITMISLYTSTIMGV